MITEINYIIKCFLKLSLQSEHIITIEGNTSDRNYDESKVVRKSHRLSARYIIVYDRPQYK